MANTLVNTEPIVTVGTTAIALAGVAALVNLAANLLLSNPIPWKEKVRLTGLYGKWAVNLAEGVCPHGDVACVEREAKRLYEARVSRVHGVR